MPEAHQPVAAGERVADPLLGLLGRPDLVDLLDDLRRGAAVERPLHRADRAAHRRREVGAGRGDDAGGEGRGVEAVLRADDEVGVQGPGRLVVGRRAVDHVQEARRRGRGRDRARSAPRRRADPGERRQRGRRDRRQRARLVGGRRPAERLAPRPRRRRRSGARPSAWRSSGGRAGRSAPRPGRAGRGASPPGPSRRSRAARRPRHRCPRARARRSGSRDTGAGPAAPSMYDSAVSPATTPSRPGEYGRSSAGAAGRARSWLRW